MDQHSAGAPGGPPFIRADAHEPDPAAPPAPGVELRVQLIAHLVHRSVLDAGGGATAAERRQVRQHLASRLANAHPRPLSLTRADLDGFLAWVARTLDDAIEAPPR